MTDSTTALIIEDDPHSAKILEIMLNREGVSATLINNPLNVQMVLGSMSVPAVIFVDLEMPHLNGYEVLSLIRESLGDGVCVAAYTVHSSEANAAVDKGFNGFFSKPLNAVTFPANLRRLMNGDRVWALN